MDGDLHASHQNTSASLRSTRGLSALRRFGILDDNDPDGDDSSIHTALGTSSPDNLDSLQASTSAKFAPLDGDLVAPDQCDDPSDALDQVVTSLSLLPPLRLLDEPWALRLR